MDPITAVSTAASILAFVDFSWKLVTGAKELYQSPSGQSAQDAQLKEIVIDLQQAADDLAADGNEEDSKHNKSLQKLASGCVDLSEDLVKVLRSLRNERQSMWGSVKVQFVGMWMRKRNEIADLQRRIGNYRSEILLRLSLMMRYATLWRWEVAPSTAYAI